MEERSFEFWLPDNRCRDDNFSISEAEVVIDKFSQSQMIKHNILNVVEKISLWSKLCPKCQLLFLFNELGAS